MQHERIKLDDLSAAISGLAMLKYFPSEPEVRAQIKALLARMCYHLEALEWLVATLVNQAGEWPGPAEVRRTLASRYRPADGDEGNRPTLGSDDIDWNRFPSRENEKALPPPELRTASAIRLIEGETDPPLPSAELEDLHNKTLGAVLESTAWPRVSHPRADEGALRKAEERLAAELAVAPRLSELRKASRLAELQAALGVES